MQTWHNAPAKAGHASDGSFSTSRVCSLVIRSAFALIILALMMLVRRVTGAL